MFKPAIGLVMGLVFALTILGQTPAPSPAKVAAGSLQRIADFPSKYVKSRNIDIWLPPGYSPKNKYPVLYMHDGQMLFDSTTTWNKQEWQVDEIAAKAIYTKAVPAFIIVGIWNAPMLRHTDYFPQKPFESLTAAQQDSLYNTKRPGQSSVFNNEKVHSDDYLRFIVNELKPVIDNLYATRSDRANTFIAGSSMGGLISLYAICEYPNVFGGAACLSTHWPGVFSVENNPIPNAFFQYMEKKLPDPATHKIYFDYGDQTLDALYPPLQKHADEIMKKKGFTETQTLTLFFPGEDHSEKAWAKRFDQPLNFLFAK